MAVTSGSVITSKYSGTTYLQLDWSQTSQSASGTTISWTLWGYDDPYVQWEVGPIHAYINGTCVYAFEINGAGAWGDHSEGRHQFKNWEQIGSGSLTIPHESDGTKSFVAEVTATVSSHSTSPNISGKETFELTPIVVSHKVYFEEQGGSAVSDKTVTNGAQYGTLPTTSRAGYTFAGWYTAASGGSQVVSTTKSGSSDETLYAHWIANQYKLTYDGNGGKLKVEVDRDDTGVQFVDSVSETVTFDSTTIYTRSGDDFCFKDGALFTRWIDDKGTDWTSWIGQPWLWTGASYARDVTLYAQWDSDLEYSVTFDLKGGTSDEGPGPIIRTVNSGGNATPPTNIIKDGKTFKGWVGDYNNVTTNRTIYALWDTTPVWIMTEDGWKPYL